VIFAKENDQVKEDETGRHVTQGRQKECMQELCGKVKKDQ
jgi:hypothetical protein